MRLRERLVGLLIALLVVGGCDAKSGGGGNENTNNTTGVPLCGNGTIELGEQCDDGTANSDSAPDACRTDCRRAYCGDGVLDAGEACDDGGANSARLANACRRTCELPRCGDGVTDSGEACDDGGTTDGDGCDGSCAVERHWSCAGVPSVCVCTDFHAGPACGMCVVYVDRDSAITERDGFGWSTALATVQEGVDTAARTGGPCEVWVAAGSYPVFERSPTDSLTLASDVGVYGGFVGTETARGQRDWLAHETILDGDGVFHVVHAQSSVDATLDGFTVQGGHAVGAGADAEGGGVRLYGSAVHLANLRITQNGALDQGGGIAAVASYLTLVDSVVDLNQAAESPSGIGGGLYCHGSTVVASRTRFADNFAVPRGGGVYLLRSTLLGDHMTFERNQVADFSEQWRGGALFLSIGANAVIDHSTWRDNAAGSGGAIAASDASDASAVVSTSWFEGNTAAWYGGAIYVGSASASLANVVLYQNNANYAGGAYVTFNGVLDLLHATVVDNRSLNDAGGVQAYFSAVANVVSTIIWGNQNSGATTGNGGSMSGSHSNVEGWVATGSILSEDPRFVDQAGGDLHLRSDSACIDSADDSRAPPTDIEDQPRYDAAGGGVADMGAFEYRP